MTPQDRTAPPETGLDWRAELIDGTWTVRNSNGSIFAIARDEATAVEMVADHGKAALGEALADALEALLPVAQHFEKQSSHCGGGRRGYIPFGKARKALKAYGRPPQ